MAKKAKTKTEKIEPYRTSARYGIQNHVGGIWTPETFPTAERAQKYLDDQAAQFPSGDLRKHKVVPVRVTVTALN